MLSRRPTPVVPNLGLKQTPSQRRASIGLHQWFPTWVSNKHHHRDVLSRRPTPVVSQPGSQTNTITETYSPVGLAYTSGCQPGSQTNTITETCSPVGLHQWFPTCVSNKHHHRDMLYRRPTPVVPNRGLKQTPSQRRALP